MFPRGTLGEGKTAAGLHWEQDGSLHSLRVRVKGNALLPNGRMQSVSLKGKGAGLCWIPRPLAVDCWVESGGHTNDGNQTSASAADCWQRSGGGADLCCCTRGWLVPAPEPQAATADCEYFPELWGSCGPAPLLLLTAVPGRGLGCRCGCKPGALNCVAAMCCEATAGFVCCAAHLVSMLNCAMPVLCQLLKSDVDFPATSNTGHPDAAGADASCCA